MVNEASRLEERSAIKTKTQPHDTFLCKQLQESKGGMQLLRWAKTQDVRRKAHFSSHTKALSVLEAIPRGMRSSRPSPHPAVLRPPETGAVAGAAAAEQFLR